MAHALVVGGTGKLAEVCVHFCQVHEAVSVVARRGPRLESLVARHPRIRPLGVDYRDAEKLTFALSEAVAAAGPLDLVVCWTHAVAPEAAFVTAGVLEATARPCRYFQVIGGAYDDPASIAAGLAGRFRRYEHVLYRQILLGFRIEEGRSRWLTDGEISAGVIAAVDADEAYTVVGTIRPWNRKPE